MIISVSLLNTFKANNTFGATSSFTEISSSLNPNHHCQVKHIKDQDSYAAAVGFFFLNYSTLAHLIAKFNYTFSKPRIKQMFDSLSFVYSKTEG